LHCVNNLNLLVQFGINRSELLRPSIFSGLELRNLASATVVALVLGPCGVEGVFAAEWGSTGGFVVPSQQPALGSLH